MEEKKPGDRRQRSWIAQILLGFCVFFFSNPSSITSHAVHFSTRNPTIIACPLLNEEERLHTHSPDSAIFWEFQKCPHWSYNDMRRAILAIHSCPLFNQVLTIWFEIVSWEDELPHYNNSFLNRHDTTQPNEMKNNIYIFNNHVRLRLRKESSYTFVPWLFLTIYLPWTSMCPIVAYKTSLSIMLLLQWPW